MSSLSTILKIADVGSTSAVSSSQKRVKFSAIIYSSTKKNATSCPGLRGCHSFPVADPDLHQDPDIKGGGGGGGGEGDGFIKTFCPPSVWSKKNSGGGPPGSATAFSGVYHVVDQAKQAQTGRFDATSSHIANVFQSWSTVTGYEEFIAGEFKPFRNREIF